MPTDKKSYEIPTKPDELLVWAERRKDEGFCIDEFTGKQNLAFVLGEQFGVWNADRRRFDKPRAHRGDPNAPVRVTVNKVGGLVERVIARLTKSSPIPECRPVTDTDTDVDAAKVGTRILDHEMNRLSFQQRLMELYFWVLPLGWSFAYVCWDPDEGSLVAEDPDTGEPLHQGEVHMEEVPGFELTVDPNARHFRDARWCVRTVSMTKEAAYEQYGKVLAGAESSSSHIDEWRMDSRATNSNSNAHGKDGFIAVHQLWLRPGGRVRPEGLVFTWSGKLILEDPMPFPYAHGRLPFVPLNLLPSLGGGPAGRTWVTDLVGIQRDYNDARSREAAIRRVLTPKVLAARGQVDPNRMTSRVEIIDYNPTGPDPKFLMPDGRWMAQYEQAMSRADAEMGDRAGQGEVSSGNAASSAPAASILALQEADETKLAISAKEQAAFIQDLGFQILMLVKQYWSEERTVRTWSRDGELEVSRFSSSDLADQLDVHVSSESALPRSKSARAQLAIDLWSQQIISDPRHFVRMLDLPGTDFLVETLNRDAKQAAREHADLINLRPVEAKAWHNHQAHITAHDELRKSEEYEALDAQQRAWIDGHVTMHYQVLQTQLMAQASPPPPGKSNGAETTNPGGKNGEYTNPMTGKPQDPLQVAAGLAPSSLRGSEVQGRGVVGGTGNPGSVPGASNDTVAARTGN